MLDITSRLEIIRSLVANDTIQSLTYAALESRLTLECICYERFKLYYPYTSEKDLKHWKPSSVVRQVANEIDKRIVEGFKLEISRTPHKEGLEPQTIEEFEACDYVKLGEQAPLHLKKIDKLWNSLSNLGLHVRIEELTSNEVSPYGEKNALKSKILEAIDYLESCQGSILLGGVLERTMNAKCDGCGTEIRKPLSTPKETIVRCVNPNCKESYHFQLVNEQVEVIRRLWHANCSHCDYPIIVPLAEFDRLQLGSRFKVSCNNCSESSEFSLGVKKMS